MSIASIPARLRAEARSTTSLEEDESPLSRVITNELLDIKSPRLWRGAVAEFVGTALLSIFTIGLGLKKDEQEGPSLLQGALGTGFFLAGLISAFSNVSGAHVNPAISIGFLVTRQITFVRCLAYSIFQTTGAVAGTAFLKVVIPSDLIGNLGLINPGSGITPYEALGVEILITFFLMFVVLSLIDPGRDDLAGSVPLMVGLTVTVNILFAGQLSGACMNPARNFGSALMMGDFENNWLYWAGPTAGAILGALSYDWFFSTSPFEINALKKLTGKDDERENKIGMYGINGNEKDLNLQIDDENEDDEEEANKIMLKEKLRREYTNGLPRDVDKREFNEFRRTSLKDKLQSGSLGKISIKEEESNENLSLGNLAAAPESKV